MRFYQNSGTLVGLASAMTIFIVKIAVKNRRVCGPLGFKYLVFVS